jgi:hypothetical protein
MTRPRRMLGLSAILFVRVSVKTTQVTTIKTTRKQQHTKHYFSKNNYLSYYNKQIKIKNLYVSTSAWK